MRKKLIRLIRRRRFDSVQQMEDELRLALNVRDDNPVLLGVYMVIEGMEQDRMDASAVAGLAADEAKAEARAAGCLRELQEVIREQVKKSQQENK